MYADLTMLKNEVIWRGGSNEPDLVPDVSVLRLQDGVDKESTLIHWSPGARSPIVNYVQNAKNAQIV